MTLNEFAESKGIPVLKCIDCVKYNEVCGRGFCGNKYRISHKDALKEVYCMKKNARKRNDG